MMDLRDEEMKTTRLRSRLLPGTRRSGGWTIAENILALAILGLLLAGMASSQEHARKFNTIMLAKQRCTAAAQGQLDCIAATGGPLAEEKLRELWPEVRVATERTGGQGQWAGLTLVKVTAGAAAAGREVNVVLTRYMPAEVQP